MSKRLLNNYEASREMDSFKAMYLDPLSAQVKKAYTILQDDKYEWKNAKQKEQAKEKYNYLDSQLINFTRMHNTVYKLIHEHEGLATAMGDLYMAWHNNVAYKGKQQREMMEEQARILQGIFVTLYDLLKPLNLNIPEPQRK